MELTLDETEILNGLSKMLKNKSDSSNDVICRPGTKDDILAPDILPLTDEEKNPREKKYWELISDGNTSTLYSEQEFKRDFLGEPDEDSVYDDDPRIVAEFNIIEGEERTIEDNADTISSMSVFGGKKKNFYVVKIELKNEDPKTIDIDLREDKLYLYSHRYKLRTHFPKQVNVESARTTFFAQKYLLEIRIKEL